VEVDPATLIRAARWAGSEHGLPGWTELCAGLRGAGLAEEARRLQKFEWDPQDPEPGSLRRAVEESGAFAESRWAGEGPPPEDLKFELLRLRERLAARPGEAGQEALLVLLKGVLGRIREIQRGLEAQGPTLRLRAEVPGRGGRGLALSLTRRRGAAGEPLQFSAWVTLQGGGGVKADFILQGNRVEAEIRAPEGLAARMAPRAVELEAGLRARGLEPGRVRVGPEGA
jgi:hypothetical protein